MTPAEVEVVARVALGYSTPRIATSLGLTTGTVKQYLARVYRKLELDSTLSKRYQLCEWWRSGPQPVIIPFPWLGDKESDAA